MPLLPQQPLGLPPGPPPAPGAASPAPPMGGYPPPQVGSSSTPPGAGPDPGGMGGGAPLGPGGPSGVMGAPGPMLDPAMKQMLLKATASALVGALQNLTNPAGAAAVTQTYIPTPPTLDSAYTS